MVANQSRWYPSRLHKPDGTLEQWRPSAELTGGGCGVNLQSTSNGQWSHRLTEGNEMMSSGVVERGH